MRFRVTILLFFFVLVISALGQDTISNEMLSLLNTARLEISSPILYFNPQLQTAAQAHSYDMAASETLAHLGTDGSQFWQRIQDTGYPLTTGAENVLSRGDTNVQAAFQQWYNSEGHRQNMLNPAYQEVGIAYARSATGRYYFTLVLAARADFVPPTVAPATPAASSTALPSLTPTFTPTAYPTDVFAATLAAPLPTNTANVPVPVGQAPLRTHVEREGQQTQFVLGAPTVPYGDRRRYAVTLVSLMLGVGMSSRLFQRVREERGLAYAIYTFQSYHLDTGMQGVYVRTSPETAEGALEEILRELGDVSRGGFPAAEVESGKNQLKGQLTLSLESPATRMFRVAATELYGEPFHPVDDILARIDAITPEEVAAVAEEFFDPERQTVLTLGRTQTD